MSNRIGILTFWGVPNFGAWAQAYALNNVVRELAGENHIVEHINYLSPIHYDMYYKNNERLKNSFHYCWSEIPHSDRYDSERLEKEEYDLIITGSDAIWEYSMESTGDDAHLVGNGLNTKKLISYAASAGVSVDCEKDFVKKGLKRYHSVSVRDEATQKMVERLVGISPIIVPDPSLLYAFGKDESIPLPVYDKYILVYGAIWDKPYIEKIKKFARERHLILISAGCLNDWCDINFRMIELRVKEWIGLIKNAEYVAASMFHGLMLGLNLGKVVFFDQVEYVRNRSQSLLSYLKIPYYSEYSNDYLVPDEWDLNEISKSLDEYIAIGKGFLMENIKAL